MGNKGEQFSHPRVRGSNKKGILGRRHERRRGAEGGFAEQSTSERASLAQRTAWVEARIVKEPSALESYRQFFQLN